jgi:hypothetical protein
MPAPIPPFTRETAVTKVRMAEDGWNSRDPHRVSLAYTEDSQWRNRAEFINGRAEIVAFLTRKWHKELDYRLIKNYGPSPRTGSPFASLMSGMTTAATGSALTATKTGNSMLMA